MSTPLRVHRGQRANERHNLRVQLVAAMMAGKAGVIVNDSDTRHGTAEAAGLLIEVADAIIDALEAALAREKA